MMVSAKLPTLKCPLLRSSRRSLIWILIAAAPWLSVRAADDDAEVPAKKTPIGQMLTVTSPVDDIVSARISNAAIKLQNQSTQEGRPAFLILQIDPGTSQFHHVQGLAKFLTSAQISNVTTVAWIPQTVTGPNVLIALACKQIVMHPDAELGDIGRGKPLEADERDAALLLAQKRHNPKINSAIVRGMMDKDEQLWLVQTKSTDEGKEQLESRVMTNAEKLSLLKTDLEIPIRPQLIKEAGTPGVFSGQAARKLDFLVVQTAESRGAVAELYSLPREALREQTADNEVRKVRLIKVDGVIDTMQESFLVRQIDRAVAGGAQVIVFEIDSPGGLLMSSINLAQAIVRLEDHKIRTIAYVPAEAISGAAIISLGCDEIIMHPDAKIGDAGPIEMRPGQPFERAPEKVLSLLRVALADLAEKKHRPIALCEAMADRTLKVFQVTHRDNGRVWYMSEAEIRDSNGEWITGPQLRETNGELLFTANGERAHELKLAEPTVQDFSELKSRIGLPPNAELKPIEKTWVDDLVFTLNHPAMVVFMIVLGVALIYLELHFMTGILGILSVLCFALFFWARFLGGTAGWLEIVLFVLGLGCLGLEFFVIPGFGVFGVSGILLVLASLILAGHTWTFDLTTNIEELSWLTGQVLLSLGVVGLIGLGTAKYLPRIPMFESIILGPPGTTGEAEPQLRPDSGGPMQSVSSDGIAVGTQGVALTMLRPAGKAMINDQMVDVVSDGPFISPETTIEVIAARGNLIVVRQV